MRASTLHVGTIAGILLAGAVAMSAQQAARPSGGLTAAGGTARVSAEFLIGPEDVLSILFWRDKEMTGDVTVRPDGFITLPLLGELRAAGLTPTALATAIQTAAGRYLTDPNVTVVVRQINSRNTYITGEVNAPGAYPLTGPRTIMQAIALAGGVREFANLDEITILREQQGQTRAFKFNYSDVSRGRNLGQNFELQPGDTIVVP